MKKYVLIFSLLGSFLTGSVNSFAQKLDIPFEEYDLPNGLHVILHKDNATPIVAVSMMYHVGSKNEDPQRTGFAHFFEHLLFEGSENIKRGEFMSMIQSRGGLINANTSHDRTFYYEVLPSNQLELALWAESERLLHAKIDEEGVETQRKVVKEEKKERIDNAQYGQLTRLLFESTFTQHPYRWMPIGSDEYLDQATLQEFLEFYKLFYVPENAVLSIAGDIDIKKTKSMIERYFGDIPKGGRPIPRPNVIEPPIGSEKKVTFYDNVQLPLVAQTYLGPKMNTKEYYALDLALMALGQGKSSRLHKELVDNKQLSLSATSIIYPMEDPGMMMLFVLGNSGVDPDVLQKAMDEQIQELKTNPITEREFQKVLNQKEKAILTEVSGVANIAEALATEYTYFKNTAGLKSKIENYRSLTAADLKNAVDKYLTPNSRAVIYYLPQSMKK